MTSSKSRLAGLAILAVAGSLVLVGCGGSGSPQQPAADVNVDALPSSSPEMAVPLPDGTLPCGLGQVAWGQQVFTLADYPACQSAMPGIAVYCLNDQAQWTNDAITITSVSADNTTLTLDSQREGICGLFPQK